MYNIEKMTWHCSVKHKSQLNLFYIIDGKCFYAFTLVFDGWVTSGWLAGLPDWALSSFSLLANLEAGCTNPGRGFLQYMTLYGHCIIVWNYEESDVVHVTTRESDI